ncbi:MAG: leucine-rich repeat domain-containing protein, partial [Bacteroidaceae bacterium]
MKGCLCIALFSLCISLPCGGKNIVCDGICYTITSDTTVGIIGYKKHTKKRRVVIPADITRNGIHYIVTSLEQNAFNGCQYIETLILPRTLTYIKQNSITFCNSLYSITIPSDVSVIDDEAIFGNASLSEIKVDTLNKYYDSRSNCNAVIRKEDRVLVVGCKKTIIPEDVSLIASGAFKNCSGLDSIIIPSGVEIIDNYSFYECKDLRHITFQDGIKQIGDCSFEGCCSIDSIFIPEGVKSFVIEPLVLSSEANIVTLVLTAPDGYLIRIDNTNTFHSFWFAYEG